MMRAVVVGGGTNALAVIRSLGARGVPITVLYIKETEAGRVSRYVESAFPVPHPEQFEQEFVDRLMDLGSHWDRSLLIPTTDPSVLSVSRNKKTLERYYVVACTDWEVTRRFIDKKYSYELADSIGVPAPKTVVPRSVEEVEQCGKVVEYPCLVKPSQGHSYSALFRQKMALVSSLGEMLEAYRDATGAGIEVMIQEYIPGGDAAGANYNSYFWDGQPMVEFTAAKVRNGPPQTGSPRVAVSAMVPEVIEPGRKILRAMEFSGFSCSEFKRDPRDGVYKFMEVNGRHNLSAALAVRCGIDFPWIQYSHLALGELPSQSDYELGVYWIDVARDIYFSARHWKDERYSPKQYLAPYFGRRTFAELSLRDPLPFLKMWAGMAAESASRVRGRPRTQPANAPLSGAETALH